MKQWLSTLSPRAILAFGFAVYVVYGFPGYMSTDSVFQLDEARHLRFSDGHPPIMALQWAVFDRIVAGPVLMFLFQGLLFLGGVYGIFVRLLSARAAAWAAIAVLLFPPVLVVMTVVWKDTQMAAYMVAGCALMLHPRLRLRVLGLVCLTIAAALRHNAFAAVIPLAFFIFEWRAGIRWWKRFAVAGVAAIVLVGGAFAASRLLAGRHVTLTPIYHDIAGAIARTDPKTDEELRYILRGTPLVVTKDIQAAAQRVHALGRANNVVVGPYRIFDPPSTPEQQAAMSRVWKELVFGDPAAYFLSHWDTFSNLLGLGRDPAIPYPVWNLFLEERGTMLGLHHEASWSRTQWWLGRAFDWLHWNSSLFAPYVYGILALILLAGFARDRVSIGLLTSGLLYELSFYPFGATPDYRYSHWMITSFCIALVLVVARRMRSRAS